MRWGLEHCMGAGANYFWAYERRGQGGIARIQEGPQLGGSRESARNALAGTLPYFDCSRSLSKWYWTVGSYRFLLPQLRKALFDLTLPSNNQYPQMSPPLQIPGNAKPGTIP